MTKLKDRLRERHPMTCIFIGGASPDLVEIAGHAGFDFVVIDMEHGAISVADQYHLVRAADAVGIPALVRIAEISRPAILQSLDAGAAGILAPAVETVKQVEELVRLSRYPPAGDRSAAHYTRALKYSRGFTPAAFLDSEADIAIGVLIETPAGVEAAPAIIQMPQVDFVVTGKMDLSVRYDPKGIVKDVDSLLFQLGPHAKSHGKSIAGAAADPQGARRYIDNGYNILVASAHTMIMQAAITANQSMRSCWLQNGG